MERSRLVTILLVLLIVIAALFLAQMLWQLLSAYADILILFALSWLVSFLLNPIVVRISEHPFPRALVGVLEPVVGCPRAQALGRMRISRPMAVFIVYLGLLLAVVLGAALLVPDIVIQLSQLASRLSEYVLHAPAWSTQVETELRRVGIDVSMDQQLRNVVAGLQNLAGSIVQNALSIFTSALSFLGNAIIVVILSFYMTLDAPRLGRGLLELVPQEFQEELKFFGQSVNRTFGGFVRGQVFQAALFGVVTAIVMALFRLNFPLVASVFAALFMLIPLVGPFLAVLPPLLVALLQAPGVAGWVLLLLVVFQFLIVNVLMPRVLSSALGLHPLLVFAALLLGIKVGGFWGAFFGIPIAGVVWAMLVFFYETWHKDQLAGGK